MRAGIACGLCFAVLALAIPQSTRADLSPPPSSLSVLYGSGPPAYTVGAFGQTYVDTVGRKVWQKSSSTTWHQVGIMNSPTDADVVDPTGTQYALDDGGGFVLDDVGGRILVQ